MNIPLFALVLQLAHLRLTVHQGMIGGSFFDNIASVYQYDAYGVKFAANDLYSVLIQNDQRQFVILFAPYGPQGMNCSFSYEYPGYEFMYMVAVAKNGDRPGPMRFLNLGESFQVSF